MRRLVQMGLVRRVETALCVMALCGLTGCDGFWVAKGSSSSSSNGTTGNYVYVANELAETLTAYSVGSGTLTAVSGSSVALGETPQALVVTPNNKFLYMASTNGYIYRYTIGSGGLLSGGTTAATASVVAMAISPNGDWLLGLDTSTTTPTIDKFPITISTGALGTEVPITYSNTQAGTPAITATIAPSDIKISADGDLVVAALGTAGDVIFTFNSAVSSGLLTSKGLVTVPTGITASDNALAISSDSSYLYVARSSGTSGYNGLAVYLLTSGVPSVVSGSPFTAGTAPHSVVLNNSYAYVGNEGNSSVSPSISEYSVASDGTVSPLNTYTSSSSKWYPYALTADKSGDYLLAISFAGYDDLTMFSYNAGAISYVDSLMTGTTDPAGPIAIATTH